jgi:hypothetical protein
MTTEDKIKRIGSAVAQLESELISEGRQADASRLVEAFAHLPSGSMARLYDFIMSA